MTQLVADEFNISEKAISQLSGIVKQEDNTDIKGIRIFVSGSGCSGIQYGMTFADTISDSDRVLKNDQVDIYVDEQCLATMEGIKVDFTDGPNGPSFVFNNTKPQDPSACGTCGSAVAGGGCG